MTSSGQEPSKKPEAPHHFGEGFLQFIMNNKMDSFAYLILLCGLVLSIFESFIGGLIVGFILGLYFSKETKAELAKFKDYIAVEGVFRSFVLIAAAIALLIASPGLCIGAIAGAFASPYLSSMMHWRQK